MAEIRRCEYSRNFELDRVEAIIRKEGDRLIAGPTKKGRLLALPSVLGPLDEVGARSGRGSPGW